MEQGRLRQQQQAQAAAALRQQQQQLQQQEQLRQQQEAQQQQLQQQRQQQEAVVAAKQQQKALQEQQQQQQQMQSQQQQMQSQQQQQAVSIAQQAQALRLQQEQLRQQHQAQQQQAAQAAQQQQQQMQSQVQNQNQQQQQQQVAPGSGVGQQQQQQQDANSVTPGIDIVSGLNGLGITDAGSVGSSPKRNNMSSSASVDTGRSSLIGNNNSNNTSNAQNGSSSGVNTAINNGILQESFATLPQSNEHDRTNIRSNSYTPQNPYPATPASYPTLPNAIFENPAIFEKLGTDALFYIFYYKQGSYQQYLAARELKKQSWRFHKKYMTWFQRHEEPKVTTDEYEQGTYVYFDWETGWCTRIKQDFRFEYSFLEDTLQ